MIEVSPDQDAVWKISMTEQADVDFSEKVINDLIQEYLEKDISTIKFRKIIYDEVNRDRSGNSSICAESVYTGSEKYFDLSSR